MIAVSPARQAAGRARQRRREVARPARPERVAPIRPKVAVLSALAWSGLLVAAVAIGTVAVAAVVAPVSVVAAVSGVRSLRRRGSPPGAVSAVAAAISLAVPAAGILGPAAGLAAGASGAVIAVGVAFDRVPRRLRTRAVFAIVAPPVAAVSLVAARTQGFGVALALVVAVCLYDMASFVMGTRTTGGVVGVVTGMITVGVTALFLAAVADPPFTGHSPWVLLGSVAVCAPAGVWIARRLGGGRPTPALRRLDSLLIAGPVWVALVAAVLHR